MIILSGLPVLWLAISLAYIYRRPGFFVGCAFSSFNFASFFGQDLAGPVLLVTLLGFVGLVAIFGKHRTTLSWLDIALFGFAIAYLFSVLHAPNVAFGVILYGRFLAVGMGYYFVGRILSAHPRYADRLVLDFGISIVALTAVFGVLAIGNQEATGRLTLGDGGAVGFSQSIAASLGFCIFFLLTRRPMDNRVVAAVAFGAMFGIGYVAIANGTRGLFVSVAIAAVAYGAAVLWWGGGTRSRLRILSTMALLASACGIGAIFFLGTDNSYIVAGLSRLFTNFGSDGLLLDDSSAGRLVLLERGWDLFSSSPFFGHGVGSYGTITGLSYPHNLFVELLAESGLFVTSMLAVILIGVCIVGVRLVRIVGASSAVTIALGLFLIGVVHQQLSGAFWTAKPMFLFMGAIVGSYQAVAWDRVNVKMKIKRTAGRAVSRLGRPPVS